MFAGLPGTGLGGIFYLLLTLWMPVHELYLTLRGRSSAARWRFIAARWILFALVIVIMWGQVELLRGFFPQGAPAAGAALVNSVGGTVGVKVNANTGGGVLLTSGVYTVLVLASVILFVHLLRLALWYRARFDELAYQEDLPGEWTRFKGHVGAHAREMAEHTEEAWGRLRSATRRTVPRYR